MSEEVNENYNDDVFVYDNEVSSLSLFSMQESRNTLMDIYVEDEEYEENAFARNENNTTPKIQNVNISAIIDMKHCDEVMQSLLSRLTAEFDSDEDQCNLTITELPADADIDSEFSKRFSVLNDDSQKKINIVAPEESVISFYEPGRIQSKRSYKDENSEVAEEVTAPKRLCSEESVRKLPLSTDYNRENVTSCNSKTDQSSCGSAGDRKQADIDNFKRKWKVAELADPNVNMTCATYARRRNLRNILTEGIDKHNALIVPMKQMMQNVDLMKIEAAMCKRFREWRRRNDSLLKEEMEIVANDRFTNRVPRNISINTIRAVQMKHRERMRQFELCHAVECSVLQKLKSSKSKTFECDASFIGVQLRQPIQTRSKYRDYGIRKLYLPEQLAIAIVVEDDIYKGFYGDYL